MGVNGNATRFDSYIAISQTCARQNQETRREGRTKRVARRRPSTEGVHIICRWSIPLLLEGWAHFDERREIASVEYDGGSADPYAEPWWGEIDDAEGCEAGQIRCAVDVCGHVEVVCVSGLACSVPTCRN